MCGYTNWYYKNSSPENCLQLADNHWFLAVKILSGYRCASALHAVSMCLRLSFNVRLSTGYSYVFEQHADQKVSLLRVGNPQNGTAITSCRVIATFSKPISHMQTLHAMCDV